MYFPQMCWRITKKDSKVRLKISLIPYKEHWMLTRRHVDYVIVASRLSYGGGGDLDFRNGEYNEKGESCKNN